MERNEAGFYWPGANQEDFRINHIQCDEHTTPIGMASHDLSPDLLKGTVDSNEIDSDARTVQQLFEELTERSVTILSQRFGAE